LEDGLAILAVLLDDGLGDSVILLDVLIYSSSFSESEELVSSIIGSTTLPDRK